MIRQIPNILTLVNLALGASSIILTLSGYPLFGGWFIIFAAIFDLFDGLAARLLDAKSEIGNILDSLADVVSFGMAPAVVIYHLLEQTYFVMGIHGEGLPVLPFISLLVVIAAAWRLARFSGTQSGTDHFKGLPAPAGGLFIASLPLIRNRFSDIEVLFNLLSNHWVLLVIVFVISGLMVSKVPMLTMKFRNLRWTENSSRFLLIGLSLVLVILIQCAALPLIVFSYILLSLIETKTFRN